MAPSKWPATGAGGDGQSASGRVRRARTLRTFWGPLVAVLLIPLLYSFLYLWAYWDPYARLSDLPVAVVNEDRGAPYQGEQVQLGAELVNRLRNDQGLHWVVMSRAEAEKALKEGRVYMVMVIPRDFSQRAVHIGDAGALRATIRLETNPASNFLAAQMGESAARRIHQVLSEELTERFVSETLAAVREGVAGLEAAAEAGRKLEGGTREASQAAGRLTAGTYDLGRGVEELRSGTVRLASGSDRLASGLERSTGSAGRLRAGAAELAAAGVTLRDAATVLAGNSRSLAAGLRQAAAGAAELAGGAGQVERGIDQLDRGAGELEAAGEAMGNRLAMASTGARRLAEALDAWARARGLEGDPALAAIRGQLAELAGGLDEAARNAGQVARGAAGLQDSTRRLKVAQQQVVAGTGQLAAQLDKAAGGSASLARGAEQLAGGTAELAGHLDELAAGIDQWADGQSRLQAGARDLQAGLHQMVAGTEELASGTRQLAGGADALARGLHRLEQSQHAFTVALEDRAGAARAAAVPVQETADRVASPVQLVVGKLHDVPNWGTGFTPYFLPLSLFVGAMILSLVFDPNRTWLPQPATPGTAARWLARNYGFYAAVTTGQALVAGTALVRGLGLKPVLPGMFMLAGVVTALCFGAIALLLVTALGDAGRLLGVVLLMLQLTSSGGTYPVELQPAFFRTVSRYLPMTHAVAALRAAVSAGDPARAQRELVLLGGIAAGCLVVALLVAVVRGRWPWFLRHNVVGRHSAGAGREPAA
ncbi:YhgE/Pip C-terminal domain protein [Thermaerobacter marianensis DSM 12885]|uniref:YhgE/Pip C-terminal domain protein n=1 Tax=Thermaerobacter marianensis (strain ATCC 700841 / DSM 12885 / JCM 10246 / 7p75a) TaxID=644966 RepID=E6SGR9_THEM7|nr:YhgE/Pip domain-containing protein [Thermaerobacter marianensis]ADU51653.1 YhgE/Pip C-terminal domain protein [Thermaerobacter marianensis DSM 12885]